MNTLLKTLLIILPITTAAYSAEKHNQQGHNHKSHDHDNHKKDNTKSVYGHLDVAIFTDALTDVAEDGKYNEAYSHSHLELGKSLGKNWSINSNIKLEGGPDGDSHAHGGSLSPDGDDHGLNDHMLIVEELKLDYDSEKFSGYIGKFNPVVGFDYHNFPGMYGYQSVEGYGIKERVGLGGILKHNVGDLRTYSLNFSTFFADTGGLSDSLFFKRGHNSKEDSGVANTEDLSSYAVSFGGSYNQNFTYRLGFADQAAGISDATDNTRYSASMMYKHKISNDLGAKFIFERMHIDNLAGEDAHNRSHTTGGLEFDFNKWNFGATYTFTDNDADEADESFNGNVFQSSIGYEIGLGTSLELGYKSQNKDNKKNERIGVALKLGREF
jgi:hypothetical protein